jgi:hypothetical protein
MKLQCRLVFCKREVTITRQRAKRVVAVADAGLFFLNLLITLALLELFLTIGLVNLSNLKNVVQTAVLPFILGAESAMEMPVDIKFLVLSQGKTLLPVYSQVDI